MNREKSIVESLLRGTGITMNGSHVHDPQVYNDDFYTRVLQEGSLGLGESYMEGWWDCERLDQFFHKLLAVDIGRHFRHNWRLVLEFARSSLFNAGRQSRAFEIPERHYDIGNDLFQAMLDKRLTYTCGYWKDAQDLNAAQEAKLELVCQKIGLERGHTVLDIGSGWGSFIGYAAERYGVNAIGVTVSREQMALAQELYNNLAVETRLQDYRDVTGNFDRVVSLGMFEHVGYKNYRTFMKAVHRALDDDGIFLLETIGGNRSVRRTDPWFDKYIFPNSMNPSIAQIGESIEGLFVMEDWESFGEDYDRTLMEWCKNFEDNWHRIEANYDLKFYRMWKYYLLACAGSFRAKKNQVWQVVLSKERVGRRGGANEEERNGTAR
jgi:cyclopropane-fatty-acyl-phospholipid synthase